MRKKLEDIRVGDRFMKEDWEFRIIKINSKDYSSVVYVGISENQAFPMNPKVIESISTWIEDTSISEAAAENLKARISEMQLVDQTKEDIIAEILLLKSYIDSMVKK